MLVAYGVVCRWRLLSLWSNNFYRILTMALALHHPARWSARGKAGSGTTGTPSGERSASGLPCCRIELGVKSWRHQSR